MAAENFAPATKLADWKVKVHEAWPSVKLKLVSNTTGQLNNGDRLHLAVDATFRGLEPGDVRVECVLRRVTCSETTVSVKRYAQDTWAGDGIRHLGDEVIAVMPLEATGDAVKPGGCRYELDCESPWCGALTYEIRAVPQHPHLSHPYDMGLMRWL